jgi:hypothetical protein
MARCQLCQDLEKKDEDDTWTFAKEVSRVYLRALETEIDTLTLEIYFSDDRSKLIMEFFVPGE